ncbi:putative membrane protein [Helicobacter pylori UMB_G1]|nr:putative membrane protein [Helicobacter pylori UMB_G1]
MLSDETDKNAFSLKIGASFKGFLCWFSYSLIFKKWGF